MLNSRRIPDPDRSKQRRPAWLRNLAVAGLTSVLAMALATAPAVASGKKEGKHRDSKQRGYYVSSHGRTFTRGSRIPQRIHVKERHVYREHYTGRTYHRGHHHYHAAYRFPVWVNGAVAYRPYNYCGGHLFLSAAFRLPHLALVVVAPPVPYGYPPVYGYHDVYDEDYDY